MTLALRLPILAAALAAGAAQAGTLHQPIAWTIQADAAQLAEGRVQLGLTARSNGTSRSHQSKPHALASLPGLTADMFATGAARPVNFRYVRPAGRLDCSGVVRARGGAGECRFTGDARFAGELGRRGIGTPDDLQMYHLAMSGVDFGVLDELSRQGYPRPDVDGLVGLGIFDVTPGYVRELAGSGYRLRSIGDLVQFRIFKIEPGVIRELRALNYPDLPADKLVRFAIFGVTPGFIRELRALGYADVPPDKLVELRIHGVTPDYIRGFARAGIAKPGLNPLARMRMTGFDPARRRDAR